MGFDLFEMSFGKANSNSAKPSPQQTPPKSKAEDKIDQTAKEKLPKLKSNYPELKPSAPQAPKKTAMNYSQIVKGPGQTLPSQPPPTTQKTLNYAKAVKNSEAPSSQSAANASTNLNPVKNQKFDQTNEEVFKVLKNAYSNKAPYRKKVKLNPTQSDLNHLIKTSCQNSNVKQALVYLNELKKMDKPTVESYTPLLSFFARQNDSDNFAKTLSEMKQQNIKKDDFVYNIEIGLETKSNNIKKVYNLIAEMDKNDIPLSSSSLNSLLNYYVKNPKEQAPDFIAMIKNSEMTIDFKFINTYLKFLVNKNEIEQARFLANNLKEVGFEFTQATYSIFINYYREKGKEEEGRLLLQEMQSSGTELDAGNQIAIMRYSLEQNNEAAALNIFESLATKNQVTIQAFNTLLNFYYNGKQFDKMQNLWNRAPTLGIDFDSLSYTLMLGKATETKDKELGDHLLTLVPPTSLNQDEVLQYNALLFYQNFHTNEQLLTLFKSFSIKWPKAYNVVISKLASEGQINEALKLLKDMKERQFTPTETTLEPFLRFYLDHKDLDSFEKILRENPTKLASNNISLNFFVNQLIEKENYALAEEVVEKFCDFPQTDPQVYDLHGTSRPTAYAILRVIAKKLPKGQSFTLITGKGIDRGIEEFATRNYLEEKIKTLHKNLSFKVLATNAGRVIITKNK